MKASEIIRELADVIEEYGDIEITTEDGGDVEFETYGNHSSYATTHIKIVD